MSKYLVAVTILLMAAPGCGGGGADATSASDVASPAPSAPAPPAPVSGDWFVDVSQAVGLSYDHVYGESGKFYFSEIVGPGAAFFDYDNDGDLDVYIVQGGSLDGEGPAAAAPPRDRLFRNDLPPGADSSQLRFTDVTGESGIDARGYGMGVAAGDYDNDGWIDLYVTNFGANQLWRNKGDGSFRNVTAEAGEGLDDPRWSTSAAFLDYDRDGFLDLFVTSYVDFRLSNHRTCTATTGRPDYCGPTSYDGQEDKLLRNLGNGRFEDVTGSAGLLRKEGSGLGVVAADFDLDGFIDIYVANDQRPNFLWMNAGDGTFRDRALISGTAVNMEGRSESSMGVDAGDIDNDGDDDLFLTHLDGETNTLYLNLGNGMFEDRTNTMRLGAASRPFTGFGTAMLDYDNDGWLDIVAANGAVFSLETLAAAGDPFPFHQTNQLFRNDGSGGFEDVSSEAGEAFALSEVSRGTAVGDVDNDGDTDLLILNNNGPARLLLNQKGQAYGWVGLRLVGADPVRDQLHARVEIWLPSGQRIYRRSRADASFLSANDPRVLVGLGGQPKLERVRVHWPSGRSEEWTGIEARRYSTLTEGTGSPIAESPIAEEG